METTTSPIYICQYCTLGIRGTVVYQGNQPSHKKCCVPATPMSRRQRSHKNAKDVQARLRLAASTLPPEYLARNQVEPERAEKIKAAARQRREQRNARRLAHSQCTAAKAG